MLVKESLVLMSRYNTWMNQRLYETVQVLTPDEFMQDRKAFFGSICGTLNHLVVADTIWLKRFASHSEDFTALDAVRHVSTPSALNQILFAELNALRDYRQSLDGIIEQWVDSLVETDLDSVLHYTNMKGVTTKKILGQVLLHFFNHQTHHRGQVTTLLTQCGLDMGAIDLLLLIPDQALAE